MAQQNKREELLAAWRALDGCSKHEGWRTIQITHACSFRLRAGRYFPGNEEALLVGFSSVHVPPVDQLPQGYGFIVSKCNLESDSADGTWISLRRQSAGNLELFARMSDDIVTTLEGLRTTTDYGLFNAFITRIRAWQEFMKRDGDGLLGPEAEIGLFGELELLLDIMSTGVSHLNMVNAWQGPMGGLHDFVFDTGAMEVKTTMSPNGFPANIGSLEQLDNSHVCPLYLVGIRLSSNPSGKTLPEQIGALRDLMRDDPVALAILNSRLIHGGFIDAVADHYFRRFIRTDRRILEISTEFPRLTRENVAIPIGKVCYEIDLDLVNTVDIKLDYALKQLGVIP